MISPRVAPPLALDFPDAPNDAPVAVNPPAIWRRPEPAPGKLCPCAECGDAGARIVARAADVAALIKRLDGAMGSR